MAERLIPSEITGPRGLSLIGQTIIEIDEITLVPTGRVFISGGSGAAPQPIGSAAASSAIASAPSSLAGSGAIALTYALHAGKNLHAEPGQTSLTVAASNWANDGELTIINHTGANLPVILGAGTDGFVNRVDGASVSGPATLITLAYLERATIQMKGAGAFCNVAVMGASGSFERAWAAGVAYEAGEIVRATVASGTVGVGDRIARIADGTSASTFASDVANWTELPEDPDGVLLAGHTATSVMGRSANSTGNSADIAATADGQVLRRTSGVMGFGTVDTAGITDNAVTNAKLADMPSNTVMVNNTAGTADPVNMAVSVNNVVGRVAGNIVSAQLVDAQITTATITHSKLQNMGALSVMGRSANTTGVVADIQATAASGHVLRESGSTLTFGLAPCPMALPVRVAATASANINADLNNGATLDGVTLVTGDRILLTGQSTASANGIYIASATGPASRATDFDGTPAGEVVSGMTVTVSEGTAHADSQWMLTTNGAITVGTTAMAFTKISAPNAANAAPLDVAAAAVIGTATDYAREDHVHTIAANVVTNVMASDMAANTVKARNASTTGDPVDVAVGTNTVLGRVAGDIVAAQVATAQIADAAITYSKTQSLGALSVMGRSANTVGVGADVAAVAASGAVLRESGSTIGFGTIATAGIADKAVTMAKIEDATANSVHARAASTAGVLAEVVIPVNTVFGRQAGDLVAAQVVTSQVADNAVTNAKLADMAALTVKANATNASADPADLAAAADGDVLRRNGTALAFGKLNTINYNDASVTLPKMANMAANTVVVNATTASAVPTELAVSANQIVGRNSTGNITGLAVTDAALTVLDDASVSAMRTTLEVARTGVETVSGTIVGTVQRDSQPAPLSTKYFVLSTSVTLTRYNELMAALPKILLTDVQF